MVFKIVQTKHNNFGLVGLSLHSVFLGAFLAAGFAAAFLAAADLAPGFVAGLAAGFAAGLAAGVCLFSFFGGCGALDLSNASIAGGFRMVLGITGGFWRLYKLSPALGKVDQSQRNSQPQNDVLSLNWLTGGVPNNIQQIRGHITIGFMRRRPLASSVHLCPDFTLQPGPESLEGCHNSRRLNLPWAIGKGSLVSTKKSNELVMGRMVERSQVC